MALAPGVGWGSGHAVSWPWQRELCPQRHCVQAPSPRCPPLNPFLARLSRNHLQVFCHKVKVLPKVLWESSASGGGRR